MDCEERDCKIDVLFSDNVLKKLLNKIKEQRNEADIEENKPEKGIQFLTYYQKGSF